MTRHEFPPDIAHGIVLHMNEDHADAVLAIAQVQGGATEATQARMLGISPERLDIEVGEPGAGQALAIAVDPPIEPLNTVRARLVKMTRAARAALSDRE